MKPQFGKSEKSMYYRKTLKVHKFFMLFVYIEGNQFYKAILHMITLNLHNSNILYNSIKRYMFAYSDIPPSPPRLLIITVFHGKKDSAQRNLSELSTLNSSIDDFITLTNFPTNLSSSCLNLKKFRFCSGCRKTQFIFANYDQMVL